MKKNEKTYLKRMFSPSKMALNKKIKRESSQSNSEQS